MLLESFEKADRFIVTAAEVSINLLHFVSILIWKLQNSLLMKRNHKHEQHQSLCWPAAAKCLQLSGSGSSCVLGAAQSSAVVPSWQQRRRDVKGAAGRGKGTPAPRLLCRAALLPSFPAGTPWPWCVKSVGGGAQSASALQQSHNATLSPRVQRELFTIRAIFKQLWLGQYSLRKDKLGCAYHRSHPASWQHISPASCRTCAQLSDSMTQTHNLQSQQRCRCDWR